MLKNNLLLNKERVLQKIRHMPITYELRSIKIKNKIIKLEDTLNEIQNILDSIKKHKVICVSQN